jgi:hypothetical protein
LGDGKTDISPTAERLWVHAVLSQPTGTMREIQGPMLSFMSPASEVVAGAVITVDGGALALSNTGF